MSFGQGTERVRAVVPRWRSLTNTPSIETVPTANFPDVERITVAKLRDLIDVWRLNDRAIDAVDIMDAGIATGNRSIILEGAKKVLRKSAELHETVVERANSLLFGRSQFVRASRIVDEERSEEELHAKIRRLKDAIRESPRNGLAHIEIARLYARLGQLNHSELHLRIALTLAPNDRFTLRAVTRFYTMVGLPEEALLSLWQAPGLRTDPWLMSAELAAATLGNKTTRQAHKLGSRLRVQRKITRDLSELAAGWATKQELAGESARKVLQSLEHILSDPTENALAQGVWLTDQVGRDFSKTFPNVRLPTDAHEARALAYVGASEFSEAEQQAALWVADQPFQVRSFMLLASVRFVHLRDYGGVLEVVADGLTVHPNDWSLLNYGVLANSLLNRLNEAQQFFERFEKLEKDSEAEIFFSAAEGLLSFSSGEYARGVSAYMTCLRLCREAGRVDLSVNAAVYLVEMLCRHGALLEKDVRFMEGQIKKAMKRLSATEQRDSLQIFESRKQIWDEYVQGDSAPSIPGLFDPEALETELAE